MVTYHRRIIDAELDELLPVLSAIAIEGPKGVGKTATAQRRADITFELDDPEQLQLLAADPDRIGRAVGTILIDEWQRHPALWDDIRRSVDREPQAGHFLLTGSAAPLSAPIHSGAGRIVSIRMRPMSLAERALTTPTVSLRALLSGDRPTIDGETSVDLPAYVEEIVASGFPGIRPLTPRARRAQLDGYLARIVDRDFRDQGHPIRRPESLRAWLQAYAAATSTTSAYNAILDAATPGEADKPAKTTTIGYREVLHQLWLLEPIPGWQPTDNLLARLTQTPKHHLADPALAARLLNLDDAALLGGATQRPRSGMLGQLFESLIALSLRVYSQAAEAQLHHLRTRNADHEIDFVVEGPGGRLVAIEVKLARTVESQDVRHLHWLRGQVGDLLADAIVITTGQHAYRRRDGIAVVPAALLGP